MRALAATLSLFVSVAVARIGVDLLLEVERGEQVRFYVVFIAQPRADADELAEHGVARV